MSRTRLPRPGDVIEHCRLCAAVLEISVKNPTRVCSACGEVNLPNGSVQSTSLAPRRDERRLVFIGAAAPLVTTAALAALLFGGRGLQGLEHALWVVPGAVVVSFIAGMAQVARGTRVLRAGFFWAVGLATGTALSLGLIWVEQVLLGWLRVR